MKVDLTASIADYGFGSWTVVISAVNAEDGTPMTGLDDKNFSVLAVQTPNGWSTSDVMKIKSGVASPTDGIYIFAAGPSGNKKISAGHYTLAITMAGSKERGVPYRGQTIASGRVSS
jgi:hypothetical protein